MILTLDSSTLVLLINPKARPPNDPQSGLPLTHAKERVEGLTASLTASDSLLIPTPVLAEVLVLAGDAGPSILEKIQMLARLRIAAFDQRAAVETAMMEREARALGSKKGTSDQPWQKVKFDRQIIAVARVAGSDAIYSDDDGLTKFARSLGMDVRSTWDLPIPEANRDLFADD